ncbi:MAG: MXAN_5187 C-terminal domain-containing protein [Polyangiaceae bacterium]
MENAELEVALEELENRLERLRALYEQYFMGIERIEPAIPRKDVDRRIYVLRREKIRNTAKRFKLQTIISRYNTFQQYWQRICREIEQGTYKRHVIKAERIAPGKMLTIAARKRMGRAATEAMEEGVQREATGPVSSLPPAARSVAPLASSVPAPAAALGSPRLAPPPKPGAAPPKPAGPPPKPGLRPPKPESIEPAAAAPRAAFESLDLDMDFLGDWDPSTSAKPAAKRKPEPPARPFGKPLSSPLNTPPSPPVGSGASNGLKAPPAKPVAPLAAQRVAPPAPPARSSSVPPRPVSVAPRPAAPPAPPRPPMGTRPAPPPPDARPLAAPIPGASPPKPVAPSAARPPGPAPARPAAPPILPAIAKPAAPAAAPPDDRLRELHARLVEAKRQTQDATAVSMEGLAKSMKATEAKLREQHKNRKIDFDVVIKDGKAVLKPIVR